MLLTKDHVGPAGLRDAILIFDHIPKCAGTSVIRTLIPLLGEERYLDLYFYDYWKLRDVNRYRLIAGHEVQGTHTIPALAPYAYFTFLRDPLDAALSYYKYLRATANLNVPVEEFFTQSYPHNRYYTQLGQGSMGQALRRIEEYAFVGIVECFDECMASLLELLGFEPGGGRSGSGKAVNVSRDGVLFPERLREYFKQQNQLDYELYAAASARVRDMGISCAPRAMSAPTYTVGLSGTLRSDAAASSLKDFRGRVSALDEGLGYHDLRSLLESSIELVDCPAAARIHDVSLKVCGHYLFDRFLDFSIFTCEDYAGAEAVLCRMLDMTEGISAEGGHVASFSRRVGLLANLCCAMAGDENAREAFVVLARELMDLPLCEKTHGALVKGCVKLGLTQLVEAFHARMLGMGMRDQAARVVLEASSSALYAMGNLRAAMQGYDKLSSLDPYKLSYLQGLQVLRRQGVEGPDAAERLFRLRDLLPDGLARTTAQRELRVSGLGGEGREEGDEGAFSRTLLNDLAREHEVVPYCELPKHSPVVFICSGPDAMLRHLNQTLLQGFGGVVDFLLGERAVGLVRGNPSTDKVCCFPSRRFEHDRHAPDILAALRGRNHAAAVLFMAEYNFPAHADLLRLSRDLAGDNVLFFLFDQIRSEDYAEVFFRFRPA